MWGWHVMPYDIFTCVCACVRGGSKSSINSELRRTRNRTLRTYVCMYSRIHECNSMGDTRKAYHFPLPHYLQDTSPGMHFIIDEQIHKRGVAITVQVQGEIVSQTVHIQKGHILNNQPTHMVYTKVSPHRSEMVSIARNWSMPRPWSAVCHDHA